MIEIRSDHFMCHCSKDGETECKDVLQAARDRFKHHGEMTDLQFVDALVYGISGEGDLRIHSDMWGGIGVTLHDWDEEEKKLKEGATAFIMCDSIVDGLAAAYLWVQQEREKGPADEDLERSEFVESAGDSAPRQSS